MHVQFTPLLSPSQTAKAAPLTPVRLLAPTWSPSEHARFDAAHRAAVRAVLLAHQRPESPLSRLPTDVLLMEVLPHLPYGCYTAAAAPPRAPADPALASPTRRSLRGLTSAGKKYRGFRQKGYKAHKLRPSRRADWKKRNTQKIRRG